MPPHNRPAPSRWVAVGAPLDCSGRSRGEETAPAALREAGVLDALAIDDLRDAPGLIEDVEPDSASGMIAHGQLKAALTSLQERVTEAFEGGGRPLLGGDCSVAIGALAAVRARGGGRALEGELA
jgi:arginase